MNENAPNKEPLSIKEMFNGIAGRYDRLNRILSLGMDLRWRKKVAAHLPKGGVHLLDVATGTADQLIALFESKAAIDSAIGLDMAAEMIAIGEKKIRGKPYANRVELQVGDGLALPFEKESFHACTLSFGVRNMKDPQRGLEEIHRVLKPKGRCLILEFSMPQSWFRKPYSFYLRKILPWLGGVLSRKPEAYRYLNRTIESFPSGEAFLKLLERAGFTKTRCKTMALGAVSLYIGEK